MHIIKTIRRSGYKLGLAFTALTVALTMSMGAQAYAYSIDLGAGFYAENTAYTAKVTANNGAWCRVQWKAGEVYATAYTSVRVYSYGGGTNSCSVSTRVHTPGTQPAGNLVTSTNTTWQTSCSWQSSACVPYTSFDWATIQLYFQGIWYEFNIDASYGAIYFNGSVSDCLGECYS